MRQLFLEEHTEIDTRDAFYVVQREIVFDVSVFLGFEINLAYIRVGMIKTTTNFNAAFGLDELDMIKSRDLGSFNSLLRIGPFQRTRYVGRKCNLYIQICYRSFFYA